MTVSFHQYGDDFFPGSGNIHSIGEGLGKFHSINVPMKPGMNDETYVPLFKNVMNKVKKTILFFYYNLYCIVWRNFQINYYIFIIDYYFFFKKNQ